jgi:eukaryotic-like serine/threonine-protein kinase
VICPHCNAPLIEGARFCPACGKATAPTESAAPWPAAAMPDLAGKEIAGRYRILKKLGEGGMGAVYRAEQISLKRAVAVKLLKPELGSHQTILQRFNAEAHAVAKLSHPNTVNIYDFGQDTDGSLFIAMEFIEGRSLREAIQQEGPFSPARALAIALQVAASLSDAHAHSIVHRDLKPDNVMLQDRGKHKDVVRVLDFGIAKLRDDNRATQAAMTQAGDMLGTPQYMAPEQIRGEAIDGRTDVYALGCMIYEMVTARLPYEAPTIMAMLSKHLLETPVPPTQRRPELALPPAIDQLVLSAMAKNPDERPATMDQLSELMTALQATLPGDPNRSGVLSPQGSVAPGPFVTPPAHSAFAPATPPPDPGYPPPAPGYAPAAHPGYAPVSDAAHPGYAPVSDAAYPRVAPTAIVDRAARPTSRAPLYAILGVLAVAGAGAGIYFATRGEGTPTAAARESDPDPTPAPGSAATAQPVDPAPDKPIDSWAGSEPTPNTPGTDRWAVPDPTPVTNVGTAETPIPAGATIIPPPGFTEMQRDEGSLAYIDEDDGVMIAMASLYAGTNDPKQIARLWTKDTKAKLVSETTVFGHGAQRPVLKFRLNSGDVAIRQALVLYITPGYRLAVVVQESEADFADKDFLRRLEKILANNIKLPATVP